MATLQTLDRGLAVLDLLAAAPHGLTPAQIAGAMGLHKAIAYRLVSTLQARGLVTRGDDARVVLGVGLLHLAARVEQQFLTAAAPHLDELARATRATACLTLAQGDDAVVALVREAGDGVVRVTYRLGVRHPLSRGATGLAILSGRPAAPGEPAEVAQARAQGFCETRGQLQPGAVGIASPILTPDMPRLGTEGSVGVVALGDLDRARVVPAVQGCGAALRALLTGQAAADCCLCLYLCSVAFFFALGRPGSRARIRHGGKENRVAPVITVKQGRVPILPISSSANAAPNRSSRGASR